MANKWNAFLQDAFTHHQRIRDSDQFADTAIQRKIEIDKTINEMTGTETSSRAEEVDRPKESTCTRKFRQRKKEQNASRRAQKELEESQETFYQANKVVAAGCKSAPAREDEGPSDGVQ